jgi:hypothetical protein
MELNSNRMTGFSKVYLLSFSRVCACRPSDRRTWALAFLQSRAVTCLWRFPSLAISLNGVMSCKDVLTARNIEFVILCLPNLSGRFIHTIERYRNDVFAQIHEAGVEWSISIMMVQAGWIN